MAVQDGLCVHVPCRFSHPRGNWSHSTPALSYWFWERVNVFQDAPVATNNPGPKVQEETQGRFHLFGNTRTYGCSLDIRDSRSGDSGRYFFSGGEGRVQMKWSYTSNQLSVRVTGKGQTPGKTIGEGQGSWDIARMGHTSQEALEVTHVGAQRQELNQA